MKVVIINYGAGNIQSVIFALERLGCSPIFTDSPDVIKSSDKVIFPGVGHAGSAMAKLRQKGLVTLISQLKQPLLGICLGMQLMCLFSKEDNTEGLGIFKVNVSQFPNKRKIPQMGWNSIKNLKSDLFLNVNEGDYTYFAHSFYAEKSLDTIATTDYSLSYSAALHRDNFYGVQFHPGKSGDTGEKIIANFLKI